MNAARRPAISSAAVCMSMRDAPHPLALLRARRERPSRHGPSSVMKSRRFITRSPRRRGRQRRRNVYAECLCGRQVDHELELGRLLNGKLRRFFASQDAIDIIRCLAVLMKHIEPV
jgi:hypothetical protein